MAHRAILFLKPIFMLNIVGILTRWGEKDNFMRGEKVKCHQYESTLLNLVYARFHSAWATKVIILSLTFFLISVKGILAAKSRNINEHPTYVISIQYVEKKVEKHYWYLNELFVEIPFIKIGRKLVVEFVRQSERCSLLSLSTPIVLHTHKCSWDHL